MGKMTTEEVYGFLRDYAYTGHLATVREDGRLHVAAIWIVVEGTDILFITFHSSVKGRNLQRTGYAALSVDDSTPPFTAVQVEGPVEMVRDQAEVRRWAGIIGVDTWVRTVRKSSRRVTEWRASGSAECAR